MDAADVKEWLDILDRIAGSGFIMVLVLYPIAPFLAYLLVQGVKRWAPALLNRRMTDFEVRGAAWVSCFLFAYLIGVRLFGLPPDNMAIHGFIICVIYDRFIKFLFKWAEANNSVLLATLRNDRRVRAEPVDEEKRKDDTQYTRY